MTVVRVADLRAEAGGRVLVDGVGFTVDAGKVLAIVGESGSGKTTTGRAVLGERPPGVTVTGEVTVTGRVGLVPQHPAAALNPVRRLGRVFRELGPPAAVATALRRARVDPALLARYPHQLSGGQQQRVVLAQVLVGDPAVIVADEPTTGQDAITRAEVVAELADVVRQGVALILLTHDLDVVRALADDVLVLRDGRIVEAGAAADVLAMPRDAHTRELIDAQPRVHPVARAATGAALLHVAEVTARHRATTVLHGVDLTMGAGECLAVVGRSGSGKTTVGRCLAGLHDTYDGSVALDGHVLPRSLRRRDLAQLAAVQYVFQDARASFDPHRTVVDQVARTAVRLRGLSPAAARAQALTRLAAVGIDASKAARGPTGLSGGELQRCALVRALLAEPAVLVCDEITSGLDTRTQAGLLDLLAELTCATVLISHDMGVVARLADRIAVLHDGRLVEHGAAHEVLGAPAHPVTIGLLGRTTVEETRS